MEKLKELHKKAYREFYMRPGYMLGYLKRLSLPRLINTAKGGFVIIRYAISGD
jgi:hypothetical protein